MKWLVIKDKKTGRVSMVADFVREQMIELWRAMETPVPSIVVKRFDNVSEAEMYIDNLKRVDNMLSRIL